MRPIVLAVFLSLTLTAGADVRSSLDDYFARATAHGFSGSLLVARQGKVILRKGYGLADRRAGVQATAQTAYNIASLDKQFIAAAILRLEEMGKLRTTDALTRFFNFVPADKKSITLHQLLSHTSGLRNEYWDEHAALSRESFVRFVLVEQPLESEPGSEWNYSNSAFIVLERVIEIASGQGYEHFLYEALFAPAQLAYTGFALPKWKAHQVAHYDFWTEKASSLKGDAAYDDPLRRPPPFRVLLSTVEDLWRWRNAMPTVLSAVSRTKLWTPVRDGYAYGWNVGTTSRGTRVVHHGGSDSSVGMLVTYRDYIDEDVFVVITSNSMQPGLVAEYMAADVEALLFGGTATLPPPAIANDGLPAGAYRCAASTTIAGVDSSDHRCDVVRVRGGLQVLRTADREAIIGIRFPAADPAQDAAANALIRSAFEGDLVAFRAATHASEGAIKRVQEAIAGWTRDYGKLNGIRTIGQRSFFFQNVPEIHSYVRVDFERGTEVLRILRPGSGALEFNSVRMPELLEVVLAPAGPGRWTTWDFKLGTGAVVARENGRLLFRGQ